MIKVLLFLALLCGAAFAKDPKPKAPHVYVIYGIGNKAGTDPTGRLWYALFARDGKGNEIVVGMNKEALDQLIQMSQQTSVSYDRLHCYP